MANTKDIAGRFRDLDCHDHTFLGMSILPSQNRDNVTGSVIEIRLSQHQNRIEHALQFIGCANLRVSFDFDVLAHNLPPNTSSVDAHVDPDLMQRLMQSQTRDWNVSYRNLGSPLDYKLDALDELVCFRVQFCGGVVEVIAREFLIEGRETE